MTILSIIQHTCDEMGLPRPDSVIGSSSDTVRQMLAIAKSHGFDLATSRRWPQLIRRGSITLINGVGGYALPTDYDRMIDSTQWDSENHWPLVGPVSPAHWEERESGLTSVTPRREYQIRGVANGQIMVWPVPTSDEAGHVYTFQYMSNNWIMPKTWVTGFTFAAGAYCIHDGMTFYTASGGVSGVTPPTHTSGDASDGGVTWTYEEVDYNSFVADTDTTIFDDIVISKGIHWRFLQSKRMEYLDIKGECDALIRRRVASFSGAPVLSLSGQGGGFRLLDSDSIPDSGYGQ